MTPMNIEDAYSQLANAVVAFCDEAPWDIACSKTAILTSMTQSEYWRRKGEITIENDRFPSFELASHASDAALFLRDDILKRTGQRIWGLTFTLFPDGKFRVEYDYNKPDGYEETDEVVEIDFSKDMPRRE